MLEKFASTPRTETATGLASVKRIDAKYDLLKFLLSLLVMAIHAGLYPMILYPWLRIAVPLFFIMSSYFIFLKLNGASKEERKGILKKFIVRNLKLYLCWCVILFPVTIYIRRKLFLPNSFFENLLIMLKSILLGNAFIASWFLPATVIGVLIIYFLNKILRNDWIVFFISLFVFCAVTLESSYRQVIADTFLATAIDGYVAVFDSFVCSFPASLIWVFFGKLFAEQKIKVQSVGLLIVWILCSCIALFLEWKFVISLNGSYNNDSYFMLAPLCVLLFAGVEKIKPFYWKHSVRFKRASTILYVVHGSSLIAVSKLVSIVFHATIPLLSYLLTLIGCITIYVLIELAIKVCRNPRITGFLKMLY